MSSGGEPIGAGTRGTHDLGRAGAALGDDIQGGGQRRRIAGGTMWPASATSSAMFATSVATTGTAWAR